MAQDTRASSMVSMYNSLDTRGKNYFKNLLSTSDNLKNPDILNNLISNQIPENQMSPFDRILNQSLQAQAQNMNPNDVHKINNYMLQNHVANYSIHSSQLAMLNNNLDPSSKPYLPTEDPRKQVAKQGRQVQTQATNIHRNPTAQVTRQRNRTQVAQEIQADKIVNSEGVQQQNQQSQQPSQEQEPSQDVQNQQTPQDIPGQPSQQELEEEYQNIPPEQEQDQTPPVAPNELNAMDQQEQERQSQQPPEGADQIIQQFNQQHPTHQSQQQQSSQPSGFTKAGQEAFAELQNNNSKSFTVPHRHLHTSKSNGKKHSKSFKKHSYKQNRKQWQQKIKNEIGQHRTDIAQGLVTYGSLNYLGKKYMKANLQLAHYHPDQFHDIYSNEDPSNLSPQEQKSKQRLVGIASNTSKSINDGHLIHHGKPLDDKQKQAVQNYLKSASPDVLKDNLVLNDMKMKHYAKKHQFAKQRQSLQQTIKQSEQSSSFDTDRDNLVNMYYNLSAPGRKYMRTNAKLAESNYVQYQSAKQQFDQMFQDQTTGQNADKKIPDKYEHQLDQQLPWNMKRPFNAMNDSLGGFRYGYNGRSQQVPKVHQDEAQAIDSVMKDPKYEAVLASGSLDKSMRKFDREHSDRNINYQAAISAKKPTSAQVDEMRQFYLSLKPRSRRYMANIARNSAKNYASMQRVVGNTPRDQLTQRERYESQNLYQMSHGEKKVTDAYGHTYFRRTGTPLPPKQRKEIRQLFLAPQVKGYWAKGSFNKVVNDLNKGVHTHDKEIAHKAPHMTPYNYHDTKKALLNGLKFYKGLETPNARKYFMNSLRMIAKDPKSYNRMRYGNPKDLSIHERNQWNQLQASADGKSPDAYGNFIQTGTPITPKGQREKAQVDQFLAEPGNQRMLRKKPGLNDFIMRMKQRDVVAHEQGRGDILKKIAHLSRGTSSTLTGFASTTGNGLRRMGQMTHPGTKHRFSQARGHEMYKRDLRRDLPGQDDPFER